MFWWRDPEERTIEAASGITIATLETHELTLFRVRMPQPVPQPCQAGSVRTTKQEAEV